MTFSLKTPVLIGNALLKAYIYIFRNLSKFILAEVKFIIQDQYFVI